jgi:hypothetical protein
MVDAHRLPIRGVHKALIPEFRDSQRFARATIIAHPRDLAIDYLTRLFQQFQWTASSGLLAGWQSDIFS